MINNNHQVTNIVGMRLFVCKRMRLAYSCEQPFDYCPSCGYRLTNTKEKEGFSS